MLIGGLKKVTMLALCYLLAAQSGCGMVTLCLGAGGHMAMEIAHLHHPAPGAFPYHLIDVDPDNPVIFTVEDDNHGDCVDFPVLIMAASTFFAGPQPGPVTVTAVPLAPVFQTSPTGNGILSRKTGSGICPLVPPHPIIGNLSTIQLLI